MIIVEVILFITFSTTWVLCTISGLSYMDSLNFKPLKTMIPSEDPCNPLYWYPRNIPEYCYQKTTPKPGTNPKPLPIPVPLPPQPFPFPMPIASMPPMYPMSPYYPMLPPPIAMPRAPLPIAPPPLPMPMIPPPIPLPYGIPLAPTNPMLPVSGVPALTYPNILDQSIYGPRQQAGMVPGIPGLVTQDGGINILPFSDAYAELLENHKQKMIRKKLQRVLNDYDDYPRNRRNRWRQYS